MEIKYQLPKHILGYFFFSQASSYFFLFFRSKQFMHVQLTQTIMENHHSQANCIPGTYNVQEKSNFEKFQTHQRSFRESSKDNNSKETGIALRQREECIASKCLHTSWARLWFTLSFSFLYSCEAFLHFNTFGNQIVQFLCFDCSLLRGGLSRIQTTRPVWHWEGLKKKVTLIDMQSDLTTDVGAGHR